VHPYVDKFKMMRPILRDIMREGALSKSKTNEPKHLLISYPALPQWNWPEKETHKGEPSSEHYGILVTSILDTVVLDSNISVSSSRKGKGFRGRDVRRGGLRGRT
jgi:hypothetical protein